MLISYLGFHLLLVVPAINRAHMEKHSGDIKRLVSITTQQFDYLSVNLKDNAEWNLLYENLDNYSKSGVSQEFLNELFTEDSLKLYGLDYIAVYDKDKNELASTSTSKIDIGEIFSLKDKKYFFSSQPNGKNRLKEASGYIDIGGKAYIFLSHVILDNRGGGDGNGYLVFFKAIDNEYIFDLEVKNNLLLKLYLPQGEKGERITKKVLEYNKKSEYYSERLRDRKRTYYAHYLENPKKLAYAIEVIVEDEISHAILLSFLIGLLPIIILILLMVFIKDTVDKKLVDPIMALYGHIESVKEGKVYRLLKHPKVGNEMDEVIGAFNKLMVEVSLQKDEIESKNAILENLAYVDHLTGLATRRILDEKFKLLFERAKRDGAKLSLLMIDIDYFKKYNDRYGHLKGDLVLKTIGVVLTKVFKRSGDVISRYGGEEFLIVLYDTSLADTISLVEKFQRSLSLKNIEHRGSPLGKITASIGINNGKISKEVDSTFFLEGADRSLYKAKEDGKNRYNF